MAGAEGGRGLSMGRGLLAADRKEFSETELLNYPPSKPNTVLNVAQRSQVHIVERLGSYHKSMSEKLYLAVPVIDQIVSVVDLREMVLKIEPQHAITKDNINIWLSGVVCVKVCDPKAFTYNIQKPLFALLKLAESSMRAECGKLDLDSLLHERVLLNTGVKASLDHTREAWGVEVLRYEVTDINPDERVMEAMDLQAVAERQRRQEVIKAEADRQARMTRAEGEAYQVEREARAQAEAIKMAADAQAYAVSAVATAMSGPLGREAVQIDLAKNYIHTLSQLGSNSRLLMIPGDPSDVNGMITRATAIASELLQSPAASASTKPLSN